MDPSEHGPVPLGDASLFPSGTTWSGEHRVTLMRKVGNSGPTPGYTPLTSSGALEALPVAAASSTYIRSFKANNDACLYDPSTSITCEDAIQIVNNTASDALYQFTNTVVQTVQKPFSSCAFQVWVDDTTNVTKVSGGAADTIQTYFVQTGDESLTEVGVSDVYTVAAGATAVVGSYGLTEFGTPPVLVAAPRCNWSSRSQGTMTVEVKQCNTGSSGQSCL